MTTTLGNPDKFDLQGYTILIIDDEPANLGVMSAYLESFNLEVLIARDGKSGLEKARYARPDLLLLDVRMPGVDGFETCRRLKADETTRDIPVFFMTALTGIEDKVKGFQVGAVDYITKPFQHEELLARVTTHLRLRELTEHLEHQVRQRTRELRKANQAYKALSDCNQALMRATEEEELLQEVCRIIVEECGYRLVWIGFAEHDQVQTVRSVAQAGYEPGYLDTINITWADTERGRGPTGTAIRMKKPVINQDVLTNPDFAPWRAEAIERGYASSAALPLLTSEQEAIGALNVYASEPDAFTTEEVNLLMQLTGDLTFGIGSLRAGVERERAEKALAQSESKLRSTLQSMDDLVFVFDRETRFTDYYAPDQELYMSSETFMGKKHAEVTPPEVEEPFSKAFNENREGQVVEFEYQLEMGGEIKWYAAKLSPMLLEDEFAGSVAVVRDITERKQVEEDLRQRNRELALLNRAGRALISTLDLDQVLTTILEEMRQLLGVTACSVWLVDPETDELVCQQATNSQRQPMRGWRLAPEQGIAGWVTQHGQSLIVPDTRTDKRHLKGVDQYLGAEMRSIISVPLRVKQDVIGSLQVVDTEIDRFNTTDLTLLESLAATAAIAIENARLYEAAKELHKQARQDAETKAVLLNEINHRVKNNLTAIIGLLYTEQRQARLEEQPIYQSITKKLANRVQGLATVHSMLSASEWPPLLLSELAKEVIRSVLQMLPSNKQISVKVPSSPVRVTSDQAHHLALIVNELATNTIKHALSNRNTVNISVCIRLQDDTVLFKFQDNGPGYPEEVLRLNQECLHVGFDLIQNVMHRGLRGELSLYNDKGAAVMIRFQNRGNMQQSCIPT